MCCDISELKFVRNSEEIFFGVGLDTSFFEIFQIFHNGRLFYKIIFMDGFF